MSDERPVNRSGEVPATVPGKRISGETPVVIPVDDAGSVIVNPPRQQGEVVALPRLALVVILMALVSCFLATIVSAIGWYSAAQGQNEAEAQVAQVNNETRCRAAAAVGVSKAQTDLSIVVGNGIQLIEKFVIAVSTRTPDPALLEGLTANESALESATAALTQAQQAQSAALQGCQGTSPAEQEGA